MNIIYMIYGYTYIWIYIYMMYISNIIFKNKMYNPSTLNLEIRS